MPDICKSIIIDGIESDYYTIKQPIRVMSIELPDGTCKASIHELEIFVSGSSLKDAIDSAFRELFLLYDIIVGAPLTYVMHQEIFFFRHYLDSHIGLNI